jgi:hypothetical protein
VPPSKRRSARKARQRSVALLVYFEDPTEAEIAAASAIVCAKLGLEPDDIREALRASVEELESELADLRAATAWHPPPLIRPEHAGLSAGNARGVLLADGY